MIKLTKEEPFWADNYHGLVNQVLKTNYKAIERCGIDLTNFKAENVIAWFVHMDGKIHGYTGDDWLWINTVLDNGKYIKEEAICKDYGLFLIKKLRRGICPYRLAFQLNPYDNGNKYCCKFLGAYRLKEINDGFTEVIYEKVADEVLLNQLHEKENDYHLTKNDFLKTPSKLDAPIDELKFSPEILAKLKGWGINKVSDLLEIQINVSDQIAFEIMFALCMFLGK
jgi:hypothetical protein